MNRTDPLPSRDHNKDIKKRNKTKESTSEIKDSYLRCVSGTLPYKHNLTFDTVES